jgi:hypothetical protein
MAKSYADDLRRKLLQAYDRGEGTLGQLAERFSVSVPWAWKISAQRKRSGQMERVEQRRGGGRKVTLEVQERLRGWVQAQPDATLTELQQKLTRLRLRPTSHATLQPNNSPARRLRCRQRPATCGTMNPRTPRHSTSRNPGAGPTRQPPPLATQRRSRRPAFGGRAHSHSRTPTGIFAPSRKLDSFTTTFQLQDF